jgi:hypothetical protein
VFLAGGITGCPDWQAEIADLLRDTDLVLCNPRQPSFDVTDPRGAEKQIAWEVDHLRACDVKLFWFPDSGTVPQPIALFELGYAAGSGKRLVVGCDPNYCRRYDVEQQLGHYLGSGFPIAASLSELADQLAAPVVPDGDREERVTFRQELAKLINRHSMENGSNTPDFLLAWWLNDQLRIFGMLMDERDSWHNWKSAPAPVQPGAETIRDRSNREWVFNPETRVWQCEDGQVSTFNPAGYTAYPPTVAAEWKVGDRCAVIGEVTEVDTESVQVRISAPGLKAFTRWYDLADLRPAVPAGTGEDMAESETTEAEFDQMWEESEPATAAAATTRMMRSYFPAPAEGRTVAMDADDPIWNAQQDHLGGSGEQEESR